MATLVVVPTNGNVREGRVLKPTTVGRQRLIAATHYLKENPTASLAICGGWRRDWLISEAVVAKGWLERLDQEVAGRCPWVLAGNRYTAGDMLDLVRVLQLNDYQLQEIKRLAVVSHPDHVELIKLTLRAADLYLPVDTIDSGERPPYNPFTLAVLRSVYRHDPKWEGWLSWPLRALANRRGRSE